MNPRVAPRFNLLLAEDNFPDTLLVREAIQKEGLPLDVHVASDGQQAIDFITSAEADTNAPCPHFLLLDLNLPKRDGFEVLRALRESARCKDVPVLIITSSDSPSDLSEAAALGAGYFRKPPSYEEFLKLGGVMRKLLKDRGVL
ncbi:MAG TPA: response regulator [Bryobacteraceae bacterium]|nr:response regulator [Bryobacteraceae bacterium]